MGWEMGGNKFAGIYNPRLNLIMKVLNLILNCKMFGENGWILYANESPTVECCQKSMGALDEDPNECLAQPAHQSRHACRSVESPFANGNSTRVP